MTNDEEKPEAGAEELQARTPKDERVSPRSGVVWQLRLYGWLAAVASGVGMQSAAQLANALAPGGVPALNPTRPGTTWSSTPALVASNKATEAAWRVFAGTNTTAAGPKEAEDFATRLESARHNRRARLLAEAAAGYIELLQSRAPEALQRTALMELAETTEEQKDPARAQQIYAQWLARWPKDASVPEILLHQGLLDREMGLYSLAITKFYSVMASALVLQPERFADYQQLVLRAQGEIAQTEYELGDYADAVNAFGRLLKLESPPANRPTIHYQFIHCLFALGRHGEAIAEAQEYLKRYPQTAERPEVHFLYARALKQTGRDRQALRQVHDLLEEVHATAPDRQTLEYWQARAGNEIANQFYQEGDAMKALDVYVSLAALGSAPAWQMPVWYQIGLVFERLNQPAKAMEYYENIARREKEIAADAAPSLKAVVEMAKWRKDFLAWHGKAEAANLELRDRTQGMIGSQPVQTSGAAQGATRGTNAPASDVK